MMKSNMVMRMVALFLATMLAMAPLGIADETPEDVESWYNQWLTNSTQRITKLRFFMEEVVSGDNPTSVEVARAKWPGGSGTNFGLVRIIDNPLNTSEGHMTIGYAQGLYAEIPKQESSLFYTLTFYFIDHLYGGSTLSLQGRFPAGFGYHEMSIVGGTGVFRLARGSAVARRPLLQDPITNKYVVEFTLIVVDYFGLLNPGATATA